MSVKSTRTAFKDIRLEKQLTQNELAIKAGVTETTIRNIENKRSNPSFYLAIKLSKALQSDFQMLWADDF